MSVSSSSSSFSNDKQVIKKWKLYLQLKHKYQKTKQKKCIQCDQLGGTLFQKYTKLHSDHQTNVTYLSAKCNAKKKCHLHLLIQCGILYDPFHQNITIQTHLLKKNVILLKNNDLYHLKNQNKKIYDQCLQQLQQQTSLRNELQIQNIQEKKNIDSKQNEIKQQIIDIIRNLNQELLSQPVFYSLHLLLQKKENIHLDNIFICNHYISLLNDNVQHTHHKKIQFQSTYTLLLDLFQQLKSMKYSHQTVVMTNQHDHKSETDSDSDHESDSNSDYDSDSDSDQKESDLTTTYHLETSLHNNHYFIPPQLIHWNYTSFHKKTFKKKHTTTSNHTIKKELH